MPPVPRPRPACAPPPRRQIQGRGEGRGEEWSPRPPVLDTALLAVSDGVANARDSSVGTRESKAAGSGAQGPKVGRRRGEKVEKIEYAGWSGCHRLANDSVDLVITGDVGPRIIRFGFLGGPNVFKEYAGMAGLSGGDEWRIYGGHRLWHSPEAKPRTYFPDNSPVEVTGDDAGLVRVVQPVEAATGIRKELDIRLAAKGAAVEVVHRLVNAGPWAVELAPWALSVMDAGGAGVVPVPPRGAHAEHLLPTHSLTMWAYTDMTDPRWTWGERFVILRQDPARGPQKVGVRCSDGWAAHAGRGGLFVKTFTFDPCAEYPDWGSSVEIFTNEDMLELETVAPMARLLPGASVEHVERWHLFEAIEPPSSLTSDAEVEERVLPRVVEAHAG